MENLRVCRSKNKDYNVLLINYIQLVRYKNQVTMLIMFHLPAAFEPWNSAVAVIDINGKGSSYSRRTLSFVFVVNIVDSSSRLLLFIPCIKWPHCHCPLVQQACETQAEVVGLCCLSICIVKVMSIWCSWLAISLPLWDWRLCWVGTCKCMCVECCYWDEERNRKY